MKKIFLPSLFTILLISCDPHVYNIEIDNSGLKKKSFLIAVKLIYLLI